MARRRRPVQIAIWTTTAAVAIVLLSGTTLFAQQKATTKPQAGRTDAEKVKADKPGAKRRKPSTYRGRLPAYYAKVVDDKQRQIIYDIQKEYKPKIDELKTQLAALTKERDEKIVALLTPEQREKVEALKKSAQDKRKTGKPKAKRPRKAKPKKSDTTPAGQEG